MNRLIIFETITMKLINIKRHTRCIYASYINYVYQIVDVVLLF